MSYALWAVAYFLSSQMCCDVIPGSRLGETAIAALRLYSEGMAKPLSSTAVMPFVVT